MRTLGQAASQNEFDQKNEFEKNYLNSFINNTAAETEKQRRQMFVQQQRDMEDAMRGNLHDSWKFVEGRFIGEHDALADEPPKTPHPLIDWLKRLLVPEFSLCSHNLL